MARMLPYMPSAFFKNSRSLRTRLVNRVTVGAYRGLIVHSFLQTVAPPGQKRWVVDQCHALMSCCSFSTPGRPRRRHQPIVVNISSTNVAGSGMVTAE